MINKNIELTSQERAIIREQNSKQYINIFIFTIIIFLMIVGIVRTEHFIDKQQNINKLNDSLYESMYYSVIDTFEKDAFLVVATTYNASKTQCDATPLTTASLLRITERSKYIALSRDLQEEFKYGEIVTLQNAGQYNGDYVVADCMNVRYVRSIDILIKNNKHTKLFNVVLKHKFKDDC